MTVRDQRFCRKQFIPVHFLLSPHVGHRSLTQEYSIPFPLAKTFFSNPQKTIGNEFVLTGNLKVKFSLMTIRHGCYRNAQFFSREHQTPKSYSGITYDIENPFVFSRLPF